MPAGVEHRPAHDNLAHARFLEAKSEVLTVALDDPDLFLWDFAASTHVRTLLHRGRLAEALAASAHPALGERRLR